MEETTLSQSLPFVLGNVNVLEKENTNSDFNSTEDPEASRNSSNEMDSPDKKNIIGDNLPEGVDPNIPSPFKKCLFWPKPKVVVGKRTPNEQIPDVVTSQQWQDYQK
ncbi:hypothetical protein JTB14_004909 [Gonioctena quinquepunctata]|nr:hypothetical protein JTB14_004909 [Gonioctena quinquepunctata]